MNGDVLGTKLGITTRLSPKHKGSARTTLGPIYFQRAQTQWHDEQVLSWLQGDQKLLETFLEKIETQ